LSLQGSRRHSRRTELATRVFRACFGILALILAAHSLALASYLRWAAGLEVWLSATAVWLLTLVPAWLLARGATRWVSMRISAPMHALLLQCHGVKDGHSNRIDVNEERCGELAPLSSAVDDVLRYCERMNIRLHRCIADTAHELRTPLTAQAVVGENALAARAGTPELREAISSMLEEAKHMKRLIDSMLTLTSVAMYRNAAADPDRAARPHELSQLARDCTQSLSVLAEEKHQSLALRLAPALWADVDLTLIRQALLNVIHNAIEHCPPGTRIEIETAECDGEGLVRVRDHGPGIAIEDQSKVFDRFYRGAASSRRRGLGLGLAIARAILHSQGGSIHLQSVPGAGCCFTLVLPLVPKLQIPARHASSSEAGSATLCP
jgi:signal transduction histidine kinase